MSWSLSAMVSQLGENIVGAVLTAASREQCWLSLPHQRVRQVSLFFLRKAPVLGTWFLVKRHLCTECPAHESACSLPGCSLPSKLSAPFALAILQLSRVWEGVTCVLSLPLIWIVCCSVGLSRAGWRSDNSKPGPLSAYLMAHPVGAGTTSLAIEQFWGVHGSRKSLWGCSYAYVIRRNKSSLDP